MVEAVIETQDLHKVYSIDGVETLALRGVDLSIMEGEFVSVVGPSGCGKSTLLNMIGALDTPTRGRVLIDGSDISEFSDNELAEVRNHKIGFVFQTFNLIPRVSILSNVELPLVVRNVPPAERRRRATQVLGQVGLSHRSSSRPSQLSGGEQQRVAVARALVTGPKILLADEPTGNLDSKSARALVELFKDLNNQSMTVIAVTHNPEVAAQSKRTVRLRDGVIESEQILR